MRELIVLPEQISPPKKAHSTQLVSVAENERAELAFASTKRKFVFTYDEENPVTFRLEKENLTLDLLNEWAGPFSCSCDFFLDHELNDCIHVESLKRGLKKFRFKRTTPIVHYNSFFHRMDVFGSEWNLPEFRASFGIKRMKDVGIVVDKPDVFFSRLVNNPEMFSGAAKNHFNKLNKVTQSPDYIVDYHVKKKLYPFQEAGVQHLVTSGRAILADDLGLGKTIQAISAAEIFFHDKTIRKVLVVCPSSVKAQWKREIETSTDHKAAVFHNSKTYLKSIQERRIADYTVLNYELVTRNIEILSKMPWDLIILDEGQKFKNYETSTAKAIALLRSKYLFVLTGTPIENRIGDIYNLMSVVDPTYLGPRWKFDFQYNHYLDNGKLAGHKNMKNLQEKLAVKVLRREKREVLKDLPEMTETTRYVQMLPQQKVVEERYLEIAKNLMVQAGGRELSFQEMQIIQQCLVKARLACNAPELIGVEANSSPKIDELEELLTEIGVNADKKVIIFSEWVGMLKLVEARLQKMGLEYILFSGSVASSARQNLVDSFQKDPKKVIFLSTDAGGVGLNLQNAHYVIHLDLPWNPARVDQRNGRAHRINQKSNVVVTYIVAENGMERGIEGVLESKRAIREQALNEGEGDTVVLNTFISYLKDHVIKKELVA